MTQRIGAIVLAAGFSNRFGSSKLLAELDNGRTVFEQTIQRITEALPDSLTITRPEMASQLENLATPSPVLAFENAEQGMGATLAFAVQQIVDRGWTGCLICLGDMPFIQSSSYSEICKPLIEGAIVVPILDSSPGNPVGFASKYFPELAELSGDSGGKKIIERYPEAVIRLQINDAGILQDIDTPEQLSQYQEKG